ncbi:band 4.1-like protein 4 isoform X1 [Pomacea canaliculata]|uniref:band 4.1-like protein 4 isoform X1 n=2 Tax=Pomacea canaliculata TaxID=400727 RepID=UPI000D72570E|nr:band 4.1-like protein 4 isoform X1 [Pomacea canaliculata]XP_025076599.1 band 4.1-like protein 4 isoform X1 [Pomacea canaliculata]XP_025076600.1 band 4.1-like protein 4 isoform X1 [Pomacea canaliculata]
MSKSRLSRLLPKFLRGDKSSKNVSATDYVDNKLPKCFIHFLDDSQHQLPFKGSWKGCQLLEKVYDMLNLHEKDYFSLRFIDSSGQTHWLDGNKTLSSQFKGCFNPYKLYFGVKFYAADPCKLREEITRYLFFLQVKQDILQGRLPVTFDEAAELCAYAVQSELGDFDPRHHTPGYVSEFCFVPNQSEELERKIAAIHRRLGGLVPMMAEYRFLDKVKWLDMYGVDLHPVMGEASVEYFLGLTPTGIVVYKNKNKVGNYFWPRINKVTFRGKIFIIKVKDKNNEEHAYAFELPRKAACKYVWKCCVEHHAFFRLNQTQERSFRQVRITRSFSANHGSGRTQRQAFSDNLSRQSSAVVRLPSRRQPRRVSSDSRLNAHGQYESQYHKDSGMVTMVIRPEPVRGPRHRSLPELQGHESPRSTKSAPWEGKLDYGLYTGGRESPLSAPSDRMNQQRNRGVSGSDSESGISQRRKYFPNRRGSDNDSDASMSRRRRREIDSDSGSDVSSRYHTTRSNNEKSTKTSFPVLYPFHDKDSKQNGSVPSLHSAPAGETRQRRRRRRSKSPGKKPPEELRRHFEYDLKDTEGMSQEQLREIPFVNVETKSSFFKLKYSPKLRQKVKASKQKNAEGLDQNRNEILHRQTSAPSTDACDKSSVRQSQHTDTDAGDGLGNRQQWGQSTVWWDAAGLSQDDHIPTTSHSLIPYLTIFLPHQL